MRETSVLLGTYLEICAAGGQDHFMGLQLAAFRRQSDVHKVLIVQECREHGNEIGLVIVPAQTELLDRHGDCGAPLNAVGS